MLVRVRDGKVTIRPIAGTRRRGATPEEDAALERELLADPKEQAEHLMLRRPRPQRRRPGLPRSARVEVERATPRSSDISHVMHLVSDVEGTLRRGLDAGRRADGRASRRHVSGAPKVRAMEIIDELEPERPRRLRRRGGLLRLHGSLDTGIALRTALVKDGRIYVQAGGGVVADSDPAEEAREIDNKLRALAVAAESLRPAAEAAEEAAATEAAGAAGAAAAVAGMADVAGAAEGQRP